MLCCGVFDLLHVAHLRHLEQARAMGDSLIVGITSDATVNKGDGRPIIPQQERAEMVLGLRCVSAVRICKDSLEALQEWNPHIFVKGHDYIQKGLLPAEIEYCLNHNIDIRYTRENKLTTSSIIKRIKCT